MAMKYVNVGDFSVTPIGLGTNRLSKTRDHVNLIRASVTAGVQMIDTAYSYQGGHSEETIGEALSPYPEGCVVATKGGGSGSGRPDVLRDELEASLQRLKTDSISLYYLHRVDPQVPIEESLALIKEYRDQGKVRHVGISQVDIRQIERARQVVPIAAVQNHYNLSERKYEAVVDYCAAEGIAFVPFFPLRGEGRAALTEIANRHKSTSRQITLAWLLRRSPAMLPIPGTLSLDHMQENLAATKIELTAAEFEALR
jgi:aryl-alcohol dehydrogenase-like predicted oxidoreductase